MRIKNKSFIIIILVLFFQFANVYANEGSTVYARYIKYFFHFQDHTTGPNWAHKTDVLKNQEYYNYFVCSRTSGSGKDSGWKCDADTAVSLIILPSSTSSHIHSSQDFVYMK